MIADEEAVTLTPVRSEKPTTTDASAAAEEIPKKYAVAVINACKTFHETGRTIHVLDNMNMRVPKGCIYELLGPSGCGKTTLLRSIVGKSSISSGAIFVLGQKPGDKGHEVPGNRIGYMPQDIALFNDFTIDQMMFFYARLHRMKYYEIRPRINHLIEFLELPVRTAHISHLSGGQKRRVSMAVALLQKPELLIMDEPTVGVDPVLREKIWLHLEELCRDEHITILITTHYIDEARRADYVALMRGGKLLAEDSPDALVKKFNLNSLEDIFLHLARMDDKKSGDIDDREATVATENGDTEDVKENGSESEVFIKEPDLSVYTEEPKCPPKSVRQFVHLCKCPKFSNICALVRKNLTILISRKPFLLAQFIMPAIQVTLFCLCIGQPPHDLNFGVVNDDQPFLTENAPTVVSSMFGPFMAPYAKSFIPEDVHKMTAVPNNTVDFATLMLNRMSDDSTFAFRDYDNINEAIDAVKVGDLWGAIYFPSNFSEAMYHKFFNPLTNSSDYDDKIIRVHLDTTSMQLALAMMMKIQNSLKDTVMLSVNERMRSKATMPIEIVDPPVYGSLDPKMTDFMAPGIMLSIILFLATGLTALSFVVEKKEGLFERNFVAGVTTMEIMIATLVAQCFVLLIQISATFIITMFVFKVPSQGPLWLCLILDINNGLIGMGLGMVISAVTDNEISAIMACMGLIFPNLLISGILWPREAMPYYVEIFSRLFPMTFTADAMRAVMLRGWGITSWIVIKSFIVQFIYFVVIFIVSSVVTQIRS